MPLRAYLDTTVLKFSAAAIPCYRPYTVQLEWGADTIERAVYEPITLNPNDVIENENLKREVALLPDVAELGRSGAIRFGIQAETEIESWGLPRMSSETGRFFGAEIDKVPDPIEYGREVLGAGIDCKRAQFEFLSSIPNVRFLQIQRMTGACQGKNKINRNQLLDAWHLWCAKSSDCEYFLSLDFKLGRSIAQSTSELATTFVIPSTLLDILRNGT